MTTLTAPGRGVLVRCGSCEGTGREGARVCLDCHGAAWVVWRACPRCGSTGDWTTVRGSEVNGLFCHACSASWDWMYPEWTIQVVPDYLKAKTA